MPQTLYKRVLLKLSGEALMGPLQFGIHYETLTRIANEIKAVHNLGVETCLVLGGGNFFRGNIVSQQGIPRTTADHMGMLGTVMNALAMQAKLESVGVDTRVLSAIRLDEMCEPYIMRRALRHLDKKRVCIFTAGTGNCYVTTDTAAALRASELECEIVFKGTKVDGVYDKNPEDDLSAQKYDTISFDEVIKKDLKIMDTSALAMARDKNIPIVVFSVFKEGAMEKILLGDGDCTIIN
ncbi:MAG: UMP kinase [Rhodobacteraceae bacterium]|nr:UMP kinase [Paracoccaceae bacterium]